MTARTETHPARLPLPDHGANRLVGGERALAGVPAGRSDAAREA